MEHYKNHRSLAFIDITKTESYHQHQVDFVMILDIFIRVLRQQLQLEGTIKIVILHHLSRLPKTQVIPHHTKENKLEIRYGTLISAKAGSVKAKSEKTLDIRIIPPVPAELLLPARIYTIFDPPTSNPSSIYHFSDPFSNTVFKPQSPSHFPSNLIATIPPQCRRPISVTIRELQLENNHFCKVSNSPSGKFIHSFISP